MDLIASPRPPRDPLLSPTLAALQIMYVRDSRNPFQTYQKIRSLLIPKVLTVVTWHIYLQGQFCLVSRSGLLLLFISFILYVLSLSFASVSAQRKRGMEGNIGSLSGLPRETLLYLRTPAEALRIQCILHPWLQEPLTSLPPCVCPLA